MGGPSFKFVFLFFSAMEKEGKVGSRCGRESVLGWWFEVLSFLSIRRNDYLPRVLEAGNEPKFSTSFFPVGERRTASKSFFFRLAINQGYAGGT